MTLKRKAAEPKESRSTWTIRPAADIRELMEVATRATGEPRNALVAEVIRKHLPNLINEKIEEQKKRKRIIAELQNHGKAE